MPDHHTNDGQLPRTVLTIPLATKEQHSPSTPSATRKLSPTDVLSLFSELESNLAEHLLFLRNIVSIKIGTVWNDRFVNAEIPWAARDCKKATQDALRRVESGVGTALLHTIAISQSIGGSSGRTSWWCLSQHLSPCTVEDSMTPGATRTAIAWVGVAAPVGPDDGMAKLFSGRFFDPFPSPFVTGQPVHLFGDYVIG
jgi:hypothetical protein